MITCKLCETILTKKHLRRDGSLICPECGQIYWKAAVDKAGGFGQKRKRVGFTRGVAGTA